MNDLFIDRPVLATVLAIIITLAGGIALLQLPIARFPQITPPSIVVSTAFPGADAATIEQSVAAPIEQQVNGVPNMIYMDSRSANDGTYTLTVTFDVGTDEDIAAVDVQNQVAIAQRSLPQEVVRQGVVVAKRQPQILMLVTVRSTDPRYDYLFLSNFAKLNLYDSLARVKGVTIPTRDRLLALSAAERGWVRNLLDASRGSIEHVTYRSPQRRRSKRSSTRSSTTTSGRAATSSGSAVLWKSAVIARRP